jgi:hypothetical protein
MPQIGNNENPVMFRKAIVSKDSRFRKGFDKNKYQENYDRIFGNKTELEIARETSKTFSMEQD